MPSITELERLLDRDPRDPFVLYGLAQEYAKAGRFDEAVGFYDRCLAADPAYCYAYFHKAKAQEAAGQGGEAADTLRRGIEAARRAGDGHALSEMQGYLDEISP